VCRFRLGGVRVIAVQNITFPVHNGHVVDDGGEGEEEEEEIDEDETLNFTPNFPDEAMLKPTVISTRGGPSEPRTYAAFGSAVGNPTRSRPASAAPSSSRFSFNGPATAAAAVDREVLAADRILSGGVGGTRASHKAHPFALAPGWMDGGQGEDEVEETDEPASGRGGQHIAAPAREKKALVRPSAFDLAEDSASVSFGVKLEPGLERHVPIFSRPSSSANPFSAGHPNNHLVTALSSAPPSPSIKPKKTSLPDPPERRSAASQPEVSAFQSAAPKKSAEEETASTSINTNEVLAVQLRQIVAQQQQLLNRVNQLQKTVQHGFAKFGMQLWSPPHTPLMIPWVMDGLNIIFWWYVCVRA
jgi:hypothetical protein